MISAGKPHEERANPPTCIVENILAKSISKITAEMSSPSINIVLIGSGGVGTVAALALSKCGRAKVTTVLRSTYKIVKEKGWDIDSVDYGEVRDWKPHRGE